METVEEKKLRQQKECHRERLAFDSFTNVHGLLGREQLLMAVRILELHGVFVGGFDIQDQLAKVDTQGRKMVDFEQFRHIMKFFRGKVLPKLDKTGNKIPEDESIQTEGSAFLRTYLKSKGYSCLVPMLAWSGRLQYWQDLWGQYRDLGGSISSAGMVLRTDWAGPPPGYWRSDITMAQYKENQVLATQSNSNKLEQT